CPTPTALTEKPLPHADLEQSQHVDLLETPYADYEYDAEFQKKLPCQGGGISKPWPIKLNFTCQVDCVLVILYLWSRQYPIPEARFIGNKSERMYQTIRMCNEGKLGVAKAFIWLMNGNSFRNREELDFREKIEKDWLKGIIGIEITERISKCSFEDCNTEDTTHTKYLIESIEGYSKSLTSLREDFLHWSSENVPCSVCKIGQRHVDRRLKGDNVSPLLLPIPIDGEDFQMTECDASLEVMIGRKRYVLHAFSYAIEKHGTKGVPYLHERCAIWRDNCWMYYDSESWIGGGIFKLKMDKDRTKPKNYRVAYFRLC
ncbi:uncharacterized protein LOC110445022, partial [Mizuhopecten yessoensis]|uniref:uncharacterized protein LOC110445022 n=1 Tax=Mizuhopecten yessoensis TaxID=6573 RepID=UPI000B458DD5